MMRRFSIFGVVVSVALLHGWFNRTNSEECEGACFSPYVDLAKAVSEAKAK